MVQKDKYSNGGIRRGNKSKAEIQIARLLERNGIAYKYEYPMAVIDHGKTRIWYPDFYLSDYGAIIEYFGMNGDSGYEKRKRHKIEVYKKTGIEGVFLTEASLKGDWPTKIMGQIEGILKTRMDKFYKRSCKTKTNNMARRGK